MASPGPRPPPPLPTSHMDAEKGTDKPYKPARFHKSRRFFRKTRRWFIAALLIILLALTIWQTLVAISLRDLYRSTFGSDAARPEVVQEYEIRRQVEAAKYHAHGSDRSLLFKDIDEDHDVYDARLRRVTIEYTLEPHRKATLRMLAALQQHRPPPLIEDRLNYIPQVIHSTKPDNETIPDVFAMWDRTHPEWQINLYKDTKMKLRVDRTFKGTAFPAIFAQMPKTIYKDRSITLGMPSCCCKVGCTRIWTRVRPFISRLGATRQSTS